MTAAELEAKRKLKEKLSGSAVGAETEEEKEERAAREATIAEAQRKAALGETEEGQQQLAEEMSAKEAKRQNIIETTDEGLRDPTGANRAAKKEMERQANLPLVKAANAIKNVGKKGVKELLKIAGVDENEAGKIVEGIDHVLSKGDFNHEGVQAAKDIAVKKGKEAVKKAFDEGVDKRSKMMDEHRKEQEAAKAAREAAPAAVAEGPAAAGAPPAVAPAAARLPLVSSEYNVPSNVPQGNPNAPQGRGKPKRRRASISDEEDPYHGRRILSHAHAHLRGQGHKHSHQAIDPTYFC